MNARPTNVFLSGGRLGIDWSDGQRRWYDVAELRRHCPCAGCRGHETFRSPQAAEPPKVASDLRITGMTPAGNYAYHIEFSDGHSTGIYTIELLRELGVP